MQSIKLQTNPETAKNFEKMFFSVPRFPHLEYVIQSTERNEKMIALLNERKVLISEKKITKSALQNVEDQILLIETDEKLAKFHKQLDEKKKYYQEFTQELLVRIEDCNENFVSSLEKAVKFLNDNVNSKKNEKVADLTNAFETIKDKDLNSDWETRLVFFLAIKRILTPTKKK
jgi:hypothetical protein